MTITDLFLLKGLTQTQKQEIISRLPKTVQYEKGQIVYSCDNFSDAIGCVISGRVYAEADNKNSLFMRSIVEGMCFGAAAVFGGGQSYVSNVFADTDCEILFITEELLNSIFEKYPVTAMNYIRFLSEKVRFLNNRLSVVSCTNAEDSVYKYLISVADESGYARVQKMTLLSKSLGLGRATLYRSLDALEADGKIKRENNLIRVIEK